MEMFQENEWGPYAEKFQVKGLLTKLQLCYVIT